MLKKELRFETENVEDRQIGYIGHWYRMVEGVSWWLVVKWYSTVSDPKQDHIA